MRTFEAIRTYYIFPEGTKLLDIKVTDEAVLIFISLRKRKCLKEHRERKKCCFLIITKTFEQFDNIDNVRILIGGKAYLDSVVDTMAKVNFINFIE